MELSKYNTFSTHQSLDGISFASLLFSGNKAENIKVFHKRMLTWHYPRFNKWNMANAESAIRKNGWKLIYSWETNKKELYYVASDHMERFELSSVETEIADSLQDELFNYLISVGQPVPPNPNDSSNK